MAPSGDQAEEHVRPFIQELIHTVRAGFIPPELRVAYSLKVMKVTISFSEYLNVVPAKLMEGIHILEEGLLGRDRDNDEKWADAYKRPRR